MKEDIPKVYSPKESEGKYYRIWEESGLFAPKGSGEPFSMVIPPPNVTGSLHMGHALNNSLQDVLIRFMRMKGRNTLWVPGTDHAGIATQNVVEKELKKEGKRKEDIGREAFLERTWEWKKKYGGQISDQLRKLGASLDWKRECFTFDEARSKAVSHEFVSLYKEGLIYRGKRIINWCPRCRTAISDIETAYETSKGKLWHIKYPIAGSKEFVEVATTRPETMLGDTAVAVSSKDKRYKNIIGKMLILPLVEREIPVIKDDFVDPAFGTGAVKVTPAHDPNDFEMGERHNLPMTNIFSEDARVILDEFEENEKKRLAGYQGLSRSEAREKVIQDLEALGLLSKIEDYETSVGHCYRCTAAIEPRLSDQWFVKVAPLAAPAIKAVQDGKIKFVPERWAKVYIDWMVNLKDWCISRQIWWGHRVPVWHCKSQITNSKSQTNPKSQNPNPKQTHECGEIIVSEEEPKVCPKCGGSELEQDPDVLDTWFSSALWPFSTLGWPEATQDLKTFYPTSVLITGYDIITFWVSRMIMMGLKFMKEPPFGTVYIHGLVRDSSGKKMSKSVGNVIDPLGVIDDVGADALRFALISLVTGQGQDIKLSDEKITECRNFANKIWNASRFVLMNLEGEAKEVDQKKLTFADRWILSRYNHAVLRVTSALEEFDLGEAARLLYEFIWSEFCDWYVEMSKARLYSEDKSSKEGVQAVLVHVLEGTLRLLHPFMPFITEDIRIKLTKERTVLLAPWPKADEKLVSRDVDTEMAFVMDVIRAIRNIRAELNVPHSKKADVVFSAKDKDRKKILEKSAGLIKDLGRVGEVRIESSLKAKPRSSATAVVSGVEIYMPLEGLIDIAKEKERLQKELAKVDLETGKIKNKFLNPDFAKNARPEVIEKERSKEAELIEKKKLILDRIGSLG